LLRRRLLRQFFFSLSSFPTVNRFFSDQIQSKSTLRERSILVLRLCGRACVAGEAKLPSDPSPKNEEEAMAGVGPMTQDWEPVVIHERVPTELKKAIMQARGEKKLTQSQLA
ncbi:hypothetical protein IGI04_032153, partial [Brassica rapa subsp. trilocularis]